MTVSIEGTTPGIAVDGTGAVVNVTVTTGDGGGGGGVTDHGLLTGLSDDDHTQYAKKASNLSDLASAATARTNLGLGTAAVAATGDFDAAGTAAGLVDDLSGVSNQATARTNLGLGSAAVEAASAFATAAQGVDARTPTAHKTSHENGGTDELALDASQITTGTVAQDRLGTGSAGAGAKFLADDQTYKTVSSGIADPGGANDDFLQRKSGAWTYRTPAQVKTDLGVTGPVMSYGGMPPKAGQWIVLGPTASSGGLATFGSTASNSNNEIKYQAFWVGKRIGVSGLGLEIGAANDGASAVLRLGIFADNDGRPGVVQVQGTASINSATTKEITWTEVFLDPGWYWVGWGVQGLNTSGTNPTFRQTNGAMAMSSVSSVPNGSGTAHNQRLHATVTGPFADNPSVSQETGSALPSLWMKVSTL